MGTAVSKTSQCTKNRLARVLLLKENRVNWCLLSLSCATVSSKAEHSYVWEMQGLASLHLKSLCWLNPHSCTVPLTCHWMKSRGLHLRARMAVHQHTRENCKAAPRFLEKQLLSPSLSSPELETLSLDSNIYQALASYWPTGHGYDPPDCPPCHHYQFLLALLKELQCYSVENNAEPKDFFLQWRLDKWDIWS